LAMAAIPPASADSSHITIFGHECTLGTGKFEGGLGPVSYGTRIEDCPFSIDDNVTFDFPLDLVDGNLELLSGNLLSGDAAGWTFGAGGFIKFSGKTFLAVNNSDSVEILN